MLMPEALSPDQLDLFSLSRLGARALIEEGRLESRWATTAVGPGVRLTSSIAGEALTVWAPEAAWCQWLAPHLAVPGLQEIEESLLPVLASWTLTALHAHLQVHALGEPGPAILTPASAPQTACWMLLVETGGRSLPLYVEQAPHDWLQGLLMSLQPAESAELVLPLMLGWCVLSHEEWLQRKPGNGLRIHGVENALNTFWLHPANCPGKLLLHDDRLGEVVSTVGWSDASLSQTVCLTVELGLAHMAAASVTPWQVGAQIPLQVELFPQPRLRLAGETVGLGQLVQAQDGWLLRLDGC